MRRCGNLLAGIEALVLFVGVSVAFRTLATSSLHDWELAHLGENAPFALEYASVLAITLLFSLLTRRSLGDLGINFSPMRYLTEVIFIGLLPILALAAALSVFEWRRLGGALAVSGIALLVLAALAWALRKRSPPASPIVAAVGLWTPMLLMAGGRFSPVLVRTLYMYLLVGPAEELLFRGYLLSGLNSPSGRLYSFFHVRLSTGAILAAVPFGLWHVVLNPGAQGAWLHALWTACLGLSLGYLRDRTGSIVPSSILHSVVNYSPLAAIMGW